MKKNGAEVIHLATGLIVGYPPCPRLKAFMEFIPAKFDMEVVAGTHPIPKSYFITHGELGTWASEAQQQLISDLLTDEETRLAYN
jgi:hypothetical protein